jgi:hypothetical protein
MGIIINNDFKKPDSATLESLNVAALKEHSDIDADVHLYYRLITSAKMQTTILDLKSTFSAAIIVIRVPD